MLLWAARVLRCSEGIPRVKNIYVPMGCTRAAVKGYQDWLYSEISYILVGCTLATVKGYQECNDIF